jgi:hypothetical protein
MSETTYQTTRASSRSPVAVVLGATAAATAIWAVATVLIVVLRRTTPQGTG